MNWQELGLQTDDCHQSIPPTGTTGYGRSHSWRLGAAADSLQQATNSDKQAGGTGSHALGWTPHGARVTARRRVEHSPEGGRG
jgi:hypothetical protein